MTDFTITQNDTYPAIQGTLKDEDGVAVDLTGASVEFHMKEPGASTATVDHAASAIDAANGIVAYQWRPGDTAESGFYLAEFEVTYSTGEVESFPTEPLEIYVREELA